MDPRLREDANIWKDIRGILGEESIGSLFLFLWERGELDKLQK